MLILKVLMMNVLANAALTTQQVSGTLLMTTYIKTETNTVFHLDPITNGQVGVGSMEESTSGSILRCPLTYTFNEEQQSLDIKALCLGQLKFSYSINTRFLSEKQMWRSGVSSIVKTSRRPNQPTPATLRKITSSRLAAKGIY